MSLNDYSLEWSDQLIKTVEVHLHDVHSALMQYYEKHNYSTQPVVASPVSHKGGATRASSSASSSSSDDEDDEEREVDEVTAGSPDGAGAARPTKAAATSISVVAPVGSFLLRTCVHNTPFANLHHENGVGADLVVTIPEEKCSQQHLQQGEYIERRAAFLAETEAYLRSLVRGAQQHVRRGTGTSSSPSAAEARADGEDDEEDEARLVRKHNTEAVSRLARMEIDQICMHGSYANVDKRVLRLRFRRDMTPSSRFETFHVLIFFRPAMHAGRVVSAAATRKHPLYSYQILEDYLMPQYMKRLHELCVESTTIRRAVVILKCWAHHVGLMSASSGHGEGLNGFVVSALVAALAEVGIVSPSMSEDNIVRTVWVQITRGFFQSAAGASTVGQRGRPVVPVAEEKGQVAVLRLSGDVHNILFRTSNSFWEDVVKAAAEEALQFTRSTELFTRTVFQPLALRYDAAFTLTNVAAVEGQAAPTIFPAPTEAAFAVQKVAEEALRTRCAALTAWQLDATTFRVAVRFTREAEGRSRITRGPAIEDTAAVEAFNAFWGSEITSARQFPDGAIYRCVLWTFPTEDAGAHTTIALSASDVTRVVIEHAVRRHVDPAAEAQVLLGGLEGFLAERIGAEWRDAAPLMQKSLLDASKYVSELMSTLPKTALPCNITGFDIISPSERLTEVFPVRPHLALTYTADPIHTDDAFAGLQTVATIEPIHCVLTIDDKHGIPDTTEAIAMMKGAICAQLAKYLQQHHGDDATTSRRASKAHTDDSAQPSWPLRAFCTSHSVDVIYRGYLFRMYIAHYREVSLLRALKRDAEANLLEQKLFWTVQHSKFLRTLSFGHHSYAKAVRLAKRWVSAMMLYEFIPAEAIELLVANAYLGGGGAGDSAGVPKTPAGGFLRFVQLIATHDWSTPLVLPFTDEGEGDGGVAAAQEAAALVRKVREGQGMFIASSYAPTSSPFTESTPRPMIMHRLVQLAKGVVSLIVSSLQQQQTSSHAATSAASSCRTMVEAEVFLSDPAAFDMALAFHPQVVLQPDRALWGRAAGSHKCTHAHPHQLPSAHSEAAPEGGDSESPAERASGVTAHAPVATTDSTGAAGLTRLWQLDELQGESSKQYITQLAEREPAAYVVRTVRAAIRDQGMLFYDALAPHTVHVIALTPQPVLRRSHRLHEEVVRVSRGALLPAPPCAFTAPISTAEPKEKRKGGDAAATAHAKRAGVKKAGGVHAKKSGSTAGTARKPATAQKRARESESTAAGSAKRAKTTREGEPAGAKVVKKK